MDSDRLKLLICMGTRPEIIKQAPVIWAARRHERVEPLICHSGQHTDLAEPMLDYFDVHPDCHLNLMRDRPALPELVGLGMQKSAELLSKYAPDAVVTQGDTATTAALSMACFYSGIPVVHVEAGLRTGDLHSPWPEEFNRRVATLAADLHCAPTEFAANALRREGVDESQIATTGNPIVDVLQWTLDRESAKVEQNETQPTVLLTAHRRENFGRPLEEICSAVLELAKRFSDHRFIFVTHPNPNAGPVVRSILEGNSQIEVSQPMTYPEFILALSRCRLVISDSGGIQEEAPTLQVPLLITRESTERPEATVCGAAELVGTNGARIVQRATELLSSEETRNRMRASENPFGDGKAGTKIIDLVVERYANSGFTESRYSADTPEREKAGSAAS